MGRSRKKHTKTDTPLFYEAMEQINRDHPMTETEMQATIDRMKAENRVPSREQWEAVKQRAEAKLRKVVRRSRE